MLKSDTKKYLRLLLSLCSTFQSGIILPRTGLPLSRCLFCSCSIFCLYSPELTAYDLHWRGQDSWEYQTLTVLKGLCLWPVVWMLLTTHTELLTIYINIFHFKTVPYGAINLGYSLKLLLLNIAFPVEGRHAYRAVQC